MRNAVSSEALDQIFRTARTYNGWSDTPLDEGIVRRPTSANSCPARFVWVRSSEGKAQLAGLAAEKNRPKILAAPLTVIIGNDLDFPDTFPKLLPHNAEAAQKAFAEPGLAEVTAMRNGSLQGAYLIIAARALGLDCGPMSGFDNAGVDRAFFAGTRIQSNFICCLGHGRPAQSKADLRRGGTLRMTPARQLPPRVDSSQSSRVPSVRFGPLAGC